MASRHLIALISLAGLVLAAGAAWWLQNRPPGAAVAAAAPGAAQALAGAAQAAPRPPGVEAVLVETMRLRDDTQAVGSLRSRQSVIVRPEVSGRVAQLNFQDGDRVRKGQLLVQLDDQLPLAQIKQSQAELSIAQANHQRNQELVNQNFISKRSVDESAANLEVAQAKLALAQASASRLRIVAPFDGMTGIRTANPGDYLKDGADIVNIEDIDAIFVDFRLPERFQGKVRRGQTATVDLDALPGERFVAHVQAIDPMLDANGRSVSVRACIDNRRLLLRPGMFARVTAVFGERENAKVVPEEAIVPQGGRVSVYKLVDGAQKDERIARRVDVKVGIRRPGKVEILEGVEAGDLIVTAGQQRLQRDGMVVRLIDTARGADAATGQPGATPGAPAAGPVPAPVAVAAGPALTPAAGMDRSVPHSRASSRPVAGTNPCLAGTVDAAGAARRSAGASAPARS